MLSIKLMKNVLSTVWAVSLVHESKRSGSGYRTTKNMWQSSSCQSFFTFDSIFYRVHRVLERYFQKWCRFLWSKKAHISLPFCLPAQFSAGGLAKHSICIMLSIKIQIEYFQIWKKVLSIEDTVECMILFISKPKSLNVLPVHCSLKLIFELCWLKHY